MRAGRPLRARLLASAGAVLAAAGCSQEQAQPSGVDVSAAARRAEGDIANYAAQSGDPSPDRAGGAARAAPVSAPSPPPGGGTAPGNAAAPGATASSPDTASEAAAAAVVRRYFDAVAAHRYGEARALWRGHGAASGMSAAAFAASYARYAGFAARVGAPYDMDAGAGQRYVTVPVEAEARLASGKRVALAGPVVLHRVADGIETSDPEDHLWRIDRSELAPRPGSDASTTGRP